MILLALPAFAQSAEHHLAQARQFMKRGWWPDVATELAAAEAGGLPDRFDAWWLAATLHFELCQASDAKRAANRAGVLATDDAAREQALNLVSLLDASWGRVEVGGPELSLRLRVERVSPQVDPELDRLSRQCTARWARGVALPTALDLPAGSWRVQGEAVEVLAAQVAHLTVRQLGNATWQRSAAYAGAGVGLRRGRVAGLPSPLVLAGVELPGALALGAGAEWAPQVWEAGGGSAWGLGSWGIELRLGHSFLIDELVLSPWLGLRGGQVDGAELHCDLDGICGAPGEAEPEARVYPRSWTLAPTLSLTAAWVPGDGRVGVRIEAAGEAVLGSTATEGRAEFQDRDGELAWSTRDPFWTAFGGRATVAALLRF